MKVSGSKLFRKIAIARNRTFAGIKDEPLDIHLVEIPYRKAVTIKPSEDWIKRKFLTAK